METGTGQGLELSLLGLCLKWKLRSLDLSLLVRDSYAFPDACAFFHRLVPCVVVLSVPSLHLECSAIFASSLPG